MTIIKTTADVYREAWAFALALPVVVAVAVGFEALQHVVEWSTGMFTDADAARAVQFDAGRLAAGLLKAAVLTGVCYVVARYVLAGRDARRAMGADPVAIRRTVPVAIFAVLLAGAVQGAAVLAIGTGLPRGTVAGIALVVLIGSTLLDIALAYWYVGAAVAEPAATPATSLRAAASSLLWGVGLTVLVFLPPLLVHYALGAAAIGKPGGIAALLLALDALVVGGLSVLIGTMRVAIARRIADRGGLGLAPPRA